MTSPWKREQFPVRRAELKLSSESHLRLKSKSVVNSIWRYPCFTWRGDHGLLPTANSPCRIQSPPIMRETATMQFSMCPNCVCNNKPTIQSVESIPHEQPFFQKRYDLFLRMAYFTDLPWAFKTCFSRSINMTKITTKSAAGESQIMWVPISGMSKLPITAPNTKQKIVPK